MKTPSIVLLVVFAVFLTGWVINATSLRVDTAVARVVSKEYQEMKRTYTMERVGNVNRAVPRVIPEQFILKLRIDDTEVSAPVDRVLYRSAEQGQEMHIRYEKHRLSGAMKVLSVERK
jgi:hypothetical protein